MAAVQEAIYINYNRTNHPSGAWAIIFNSDVAATATAAPSPTTTTTTTTTSPAAATRGTTCRLIVSLCLVKVIGRQLNGWRFLPLLSPLQGVDIERGTGEGAVGWPGGRAELEVI